MTNMVRSESMNNNHVTYSTRYRNFVIVDDAGRQRFHENRPLVFTTRETAEDFLSA